MLEGIEEVSYQTIIKDTRIKKTLDIIQGLGGVGGDAGNARDIELHIINENIFFLNKIIAPGEVGIGGNGGRCGPQQAEDFRGKNGKEGKVI